MEWIKVNEKPPKKNERVLLLIENTQPETGFYICCGRMLDYEKLPSGFILDGDQLEDMLSDDRVITYWMPLPDPPVLNPQPFSNSAPSDSFDQILREEFLINTQNYPKEYHELFWKKYKRAEERFKNQ